MAERRDLADDGPDGSDGLDVSAALIGVGRPADGWRRAVATGKRRRRRRAGMTVACLVAVAVGGLLIATRGAESPGEVYATDSTVVSARGPVVYFLPPTGATPSQYPSVYTSGVYGFTFTMPDGASWQFSSNGRDNDDHVTRWSFDTFADRRWSIETQQFGTVEMSCRHFPDVEGVPEEVSRDSVLALFAVDGIYYWMSGASHESLPSDCDQAEQLDPLFQRVLDGMQASDLQSWMAWTGTTTVQEPLPSPPSTDLPN